MKKFKLIVLGMLFSTITIAQTNFGIIAGGNLNSMKFDIDKNYGNEPETKLNLGFHIGLITDFQLLDSTLSLQTALLYSNKGYGIDYEKMLNDGFDDSGMQIDNFEWYAIFNYIYIELPINLVYKNSGFQISAGPYFAVSIGGKFKHDYSFEVDGMSFDSNDFFEEDSYKLQPVFGKVDDDMIEDYLDDEDVIGLYRAFDFGINLGIGYQVKSILFNVGYSL